MDARELHIRQVEDVVRVVKALGTHRYVAARKHMVHALVLGDDWARSVLSNPDIDAASRDERLWRACTEAEVCDVLLRHWRDDAEGEKARHALADRLEELGLPLPHAEAFDASEEEDIHPMLVDAGWELVPLRELDPVRHAGLLGWYEDTVHLENARFEEENAIPPLVHLQELPAIGPRELLFGAVGGELVEPLVIWCAGDATYHEYVLAGVRRVLTR
jgi:hypothetical protein